MGGMHGREEPALKCPTQHPPPPPPPRPTHLKQDEQGENRNEGERQLQSATILAASLERGRLHISVQAGRGWSIVIA